MNGHDFRKRVLNWDSRHYNYLRILFIDAVAYYNAYAFMKSPFTFMLVNYHMSFVDSFDQLSVP